MRCEDFLRLVAQTAARSSVKNGVNALHRDCYDCYHPRFVQPG